MSRAILLDEDTIERLDGTEEQEIDTQLLRDPSPDTFVEEQSTFEDNAEDLPDKYRNKSIKDLVRMHQEAEKLLGRHSSEVGELRKVVDQYIEAKLNQNQKVNTEQQQEEEVDFFVDPVKATQQQIENHPSIRQAKEYTEQARRAASLTLVKNKHPDMEEILKDPSFAEWIQASKIRTQMLIVADKQYDADVADELFTLWKDRQQVVKNTATVEKAARKDALRSASTGSVRSSGEQSAKKKFRRADIIKLMNSDPSRYEALQPEIMRAYAEGRVI